MAKPEKSLTLPQLMEKLGEVLPEVPTSRTLYRWMQLYGMPYTQGVGARNHRTFRLSLVLRWLARFDRNTVKENAS